LFSGMYPTCRFTSSGCSPADAHRTRGGRQVAGEDPHRRALAGAVRAEEADDLAAGHLEADVVDGRDPGVGFDEVADFNGGRIFGHAAAVTSGSTAGGQLSTSFLRWG
jgi:hypothetical protein